MNALRKIIDGVDDWISSTALCLIIIIIGSSVFFRFVLSQPLTWNEEVSIALFVWLTFVGISAVMKRNEHVGIDYFIRKLPRPLFILVQRLRWIVLFVVTSVVFVYWGFILMLDTQWKVTPVLGIDFKVIYLAIPFGGLLALYHLLKVIFTNDRVWLDQEEEGESHDDPSHR